MFSRARLLFTGDVLLLVVSRSIRASLVKRVYTTRKEIRSVILDLRRFTTTLVKQSPVQYI